MHRNKGRSKKQGYFVWIHDKPVYPQRGEALPVNPDLSDDIRRDYDEASSTQRRGGIENAADQAETEHFALALDYLDRNWKRVSDEAKAVKSGQAVEAPLCMTPYLAIAGHGGEDVIDSATLRLALLQAEYDRLTTV